MDKHNKFISNLSFLWNITFIFFSEFIYYLYTKNYSQFILSFSQQLSRENILYVKMFQALALNKSLIDDELNNYLLKFTDNAPYSDKDIDYETLEKIKIEYSLFFENGYIPINSGMISLIFKCHFLDDKEIHHEKILKIKRKNIEETLEKAIDNILFLVKIIEFISYYFLFFLTFDLKSIIGNNINIIKNQTDFIKEVENTNSMKNVCKNLKYVVIPSVYSEITNKYSNVILMDFINGKTIRDIDEKDYETFSKIVLKFGIVTFLVYGKTHGDFHAGNILFIKENNIDPTKDKYKIGVIDFGIIYELDEKIKNNFMEIFIEMFHIPPYETSRRILNCGILEPIEIIQNLPKHHYENIVKILEEIITNILGESKEINQSKMYLFFKKMNNYFQESDLKSLGIKPCDTFVKLQLVLAMSHGVTLSLCKGNYVDLFNNVMNELFHIDI